MFTPTASGLSAMDFLWSRYQGKYSISAKSQNWLDEFFFCLLGGYSIPYELNKSAYLVLKEKGCFNTDLPWERESEMGQLIANELCKPQFSPLLSNGQKRRYRFPNKKATIIAQAGHWLKMTCNFELDTLLDGCETPKNKRTVLLQCPGLGYKSASWLLRNIGMGSNLAILDVHVYRTLREFRIIPDELNIPADYLEIEKMYCHACHSIGADTELMDLIIWSWARGDQREQ